MGNVQEWSLPSMGNCLVRDNINKSKAFFTMETNYCDIHIDVWWQCYDCSICTLRRIEVIGLDRKGWSRRPASNQKMNWFRREYEPQRIRKRCCWQEVSIVDHYDGFILRYPKTNSSQSCQQQKRPRTTPHTLSTTLIGKMMHHNIRQKFNDDDGSGYWSSHLIRYSTNFWYRYVCQ